MIAFMRSGRNPKKIRIIYIHPDEIFSSPLSCFL